MPEPTTHQTEHVPHARPTLGRYILDLRERGRFTKAVQDAVLKAEHIRDKYHTVVYLAGPLTGMNEDIKWRYTLLSDLVASNEGMFGYAPHLHGTDPVAHPNVTPNEVRDIDYLFAVVIPDYHINCLLPLAHGNGIEAGWAEMAGIASLYLVPDEVALSRLVRGMRNIAGTCVYRDFEADALPQVQVFLGEVRGR